MLTASSKGSVLMMSLSASVIVGGRRKAWVAATRAVAAPSCVRRMLVLTMGQMPS